MDTKPVPPACQRKARLAIIGCCLSIFWGGCIAFGYPGIMGTYWQETFSVGQTQTGLIVTFQLFALALSMFFSGKVHIAIGMRKCIAIGTGFSVVAFVFAITASNIYMIYGWGFMSSIGCSFIYGPGLTTVQMWYPHKRGMASGMLNLVFATSAAVMSPIWNAMLEAIGYQSVNIMILVGMIATNVVAFAIAETPERSNLSEADLASHRNLMQVCKRSGLSRDLSVAEALKTKEFWIIWTSWVFMGAAGITMIPLSKSYALSLGLGAVVIFTGYNLTNGIFRIFAGLLSDKIDKCRLASISYVVAAAGYGLLIVFEGPFELAFAAALVGVGMASLFTVTGPLCSDIFGLKYFGLIYGIVFTAYGFVGSLLGPALSGVILDATGGNYAVVLGYLGVFSLVSSLLMVILGNTIRAKQNPRSS